MRPEWAYPEDVCHFQLATTADSSCHLRSPDQSSPLSGAAIVTLRVTGWQVSKGAGALVILNYLGAPFVHVGDAHPDHPGTRGDTSLVPTSFWVRSVSGFGACHLFSVQ